MIMQALLDVAIKGYEAVLSNKEVGYCVLVGS
jgi:hypothetical protein